MSYEQCRAVHDHDGAIWYCQERTEHDGPHRDFDGRTWTGGPYWEAST